MRMSQLFLYLQYNKWFNDKINILCILYIIIIAENKYSIQLCAENNELCFRIIIKNVNIILLMYMYIRDYIQSNN